MKHKVTLITGAGQGIGAGIAKHLAKAGHAVVVADRNDDTAKEVAREIEKAGGTALAVSGDVSKADDVTAMFKHATDKFGQIDVLVNNAGIFPFVSFAEMTDAQWDKVQAVNSRSVFLCAKAAIPVMPDGGRIISISSVAAQLGFTGLVHYCASKGAVEAFTRALAVELAPRQITVNAVAPGAIETPGAGGAGDPKQNEALLKKIPLARKGQPADIAGAVKFLASKDASYVTGQVITVDGGWSVLA